MSTASLALALYVALRDRPRLHITAAANFIPFGETPYDPNKKYVAVTVANRGRRPVTISLVGLLRKKGSTGEGEFLLSDSVREGPREVPEGKAATFAAIQEGLPLDDIGYAIVRDQAGRLWKKRVHLSAGRN